VTRLYDNSRMARRLNISLAVIAIAVLFGCYELLSAFRAEGDASEYYLFALLFFGGAAYAARQLFDSVADSVMTLDVAQQSREAGVSFWRPFGARKIGGSLDQLSDWQFQMKGPRSPAPILTAHHPGHPRPLEFELRREIPITEGLRALAPEAVAAFERRAGITQ
jgi:hypothetical protein